jgi:hypothetical protein
MSFEEWNRTVAAGGGLQFKSNGGEKLVTSAPSYAPRQL